MNWWSETAVLWLPVAAQPYPADFAERAGAGSSDFYYYALDAFEAISQRRSREFEREPRAYVLDSQQILSPAEIDQLMDEWREQVQNGRKVGLAAAAPKTFSSRL
ncbi:hypothetical protein N8D56_27555 (plasmid) [Devosia sp. A8/3-2]|nr:hypothetical protein N8D56_27555 [Devosia sp. A8/3-2]